MNILYHCKFVKYGLKYIKGRGYDPPKPIRRFSPHNFYFYFFAKIDMNSNTKD